SLAVFTRPAGPTRLAAATRRLRGRAAPAQRFAPRHRPAQLPPELVNKQLTAAMAPPGLTKGNLLFFRGFRHNCAIGAPTGRQDVRPSDLDGYSTAIIC